MKLHWPACGLPCPPAVLSLFATSLAREKSAAATVFTSYRADIAPLPSQTVLTRKQNDADDNDTLLAGQSFVADNFVERDSTAAFLFGEEITG